MALVGKRSRLKVAVQLISQIYEILIWIMQEVMKVTVEKGKYLRIASNYLDVLTVDKRALYIIALEIATAIDGKISEDDKKTWLTVEEFKEKHQDILSLTLMKQMK